MPVLKTMTFAALPKASNDPAQKRREKTISRLEEQVLLLTNPSQKRSVQRRKLVDGERVSVTKEVSIRPWWRTDPAGKCFVSVYFGGKPVEFEKGKAAIAVPSADKLFGMFESLIAAVRGGELDDILKHASQQRPFVRKKAS